MDRVQSNRRRRGATRQSWVVISSPPAPAGCSTTKAAHPYRPSHPDRFTCSHETQLGAAHAPATQCKWAGARGGCGRPNENKGKSGEKRKKGGRQNKGRLLLPAAPFHILIPLKSGICGPVEAFRVRRRPAPYYVAAAPRALGAPPACNPHPIRVQCDAVVGAGIGPVREQLDPGRTGGVQWIAGAARIETLFLSFFSKKYLWGGTTGWYGTTPSSLVAERAGVDRGQMRNGCGTEQEIKAISNSIDHGDCIYVAVVPLLGVWEMFRTKRDCRRIPKLQLFHALTLKRNRNPFLFSSSFEFWPPSYVPAPVLLRTCRLSFVFLLPPSRSIECRHFSFDSGRSMPAAFPIDRSIDWLNRDRRDWAAPECGGRWLIRKAPRVRSIEGRSTLGTGPLGWAVPAPTHVGGPDPNPHQPRRCCGPRSHASPCALDA